jgi:hypothetical protein
MGVTICTSCDGDLLCRRILRCGQDTRSVIRSLLASEKGFSVPVAGAIQQQMLRSDFYHYATIPRGSRIRQLRDDVARYSATVNKSGNNQ